MTGLSHEPFNFKYSISTRKQIGLPLIVHCLHAPELFHNTQYLYLFATFILWGVYLREYKTKRISV